MKLADIITQVRDLVNDPGTKYWTNVEIGRWVNHWTRAIFRDRVDADASYGMYRYDILTTQTTRFEQLYSSTWVYYLPSWVYKVRSVELLEGTPTGTQVRGQFVPALVPHINEPSYGWEFADNRRLLIHGWGAARDIRIHCAKLPAVLHNGTCAADGASNGSTIIIPGTNTAGHAVEQEDGALIGAAFEVTTQEAGRDATGSIAVVQSVAKDVSALPYKFTLTVKPNFTAQAKGTDTYDMHAEVDNAHIAYLTLRVAESLFHRSNNIAGLSSIAPNLSREMVAFRDGIQPRTDNVIHRIHDPLDPLLRVDPDRDVLFWTWP